MSLLKTNPEHGIKGIVEFLDLFTRELFNYRFSRREEPLILFKSRMIQLCVIAGHNARFSTKVFNRELSILNRMERQTEMRILKRRRELAEKLLKEFYINVL